MINGLSPTDEVGGEWESCTGFQAPNGTASISFEYDKGVMHIWCDPDVDPDDWGFICWLLKRMNVSDLGEPDYLKGVDVWTIQVRLPAPENPPGAAAREGSSMSGSGACIHDSHPVTSRYVPELQRCNSGS